MANERSETGTASETANRTRWEAADDAWRGYFYEDGVLKFEDRVMAALDMIDPAPVGAPARMLDIGAANGVLTRVCADKFRAREIDALDFVDGIDTARSAGDPAIRFATHNLDGHEPLPFGDATFELVTCFETLEHLHDTDRMVSEIRRVLAPNGRAILSVPRIDGFLSILLLTAGFQPPAVECSLSRRYGSPEPDARVSGHVSNFTRRAFHGLLAANGLHVVEARDASIYSGWVHAAARPAWQKFPLWCLSKLPVKQDVSVVRVERR